ncbi:MAG: hypothetical protein ACAI25_15130 [Planctomycetota bacterium]
MNRKSLLVGAPCIAAASIALVALLHDGPAPSGHEPSRSDPLSRSRSPSRRAPIGLEPAARGRALSPSIALRSSSRPDACRQAEKREDEVTRPESMPPSEPTGVPALVARLSEPGRGVEAAKRLGALGTPEAIGALRDRLLSELPREVRSAIASALATALQGRGTAEDRSALVELLDRATREEEASPVAQVLLSAFGEAALPDVLARARDPRRPAQARGALLVALAGVPGTYSSLIEVALSALEDPAVEVRRGAVLALVNRSTTDRRGECVAALERHAASDDDEVVRRDAVFVIGTLAP